jgi:thiamine-phosphate pyrophosphorylase
MLRYAITDRSSFAGDEPARQAALLRQAQRWIDQSQSPNNASPNLVQLREKNLDAGALTHLARQLLTILRAHPNPPKLLINSRADVAIAVAADGVHLTSTPGSLTPADIRSLYANANLHTPIVSVSCHTLAEVAQARDSAATHILFGPVFEKRIHDTLIADGTGLNLLQQTCLIAAPIPVLALGGITCENTEACLAAGAAGIAAIRAFL